MASEQAPVRGGGASRKRSSNNHQNDAAPKKKIRALRKKPLTYTEAVGDIRDMFLEQASLWKDQAERLRQATRTSTGDASLAQQEPWLSLMDDKGRPAAVFNENKDEKEDEKLKRVEETKEKLKRTRRWKYKRPAAEQEDSTESDENLDAE